MRGFSYYFLYHSYKVQAVKKPNKDWICCFEGENMSNINSYCSEGHYKRNNYYKSVLRFVSTAVQLEQMISSELHKARHYTPMDNSLCQST